MNPTITYSQLLTVINSLPPARDWFFQHGENYPCGITVYVSRPAQEIDMNTTYVTVVENIQINFIVKPVPTPERYEWALQSPITVT